MNKSEFAVCEFKDALLVKDITINGLDSAIFPTSVVVIDKNGDELFNYDNMNVKLSDAGNWVNVNIMWEDCGLRTYKKHKLYGYYSTTYCKMDYSEGEKSLVINSDNLKIIIKVPEN
jgi:hypothetical protein